MPQLAIDDAGDLISPLTYVSGLEAVRQRLLLRTLTISGQWLTDTRIGLPWDAWITGTPTAEQIAVSVRAQLQADPAVTSIESFTFTGLPSVRVTATVAATEDGEEGTVEVQGVPDRLQTGVPVRWYVGLGTSRPARMTWRP